MLKGEGLTILFPKLSKQKERRQNCLGSWEAIIGIADKKRLLMKFWIEFTLCRLMLLYIFSNGGDFIGHKYYSLLLHPKHVVSNG